MQLSFSKKEKQKKPKKSEKVKVTTIGKRKKLVIFLWILLLSSLSFGIYKNFTAIDQHTTHEIEKIETSMIDTHTMESFTKNFVKDYYTWENESEALEERVENLKGYLTEELQTLNADMIREDIPTRSSVNEIDIWSITEETEVTYSVVFSVEQRITEDDEDPTLTYSTYRIVLYQDEQKNLVVIQNPVLWHEPKKSDYAPEQVESNGTINATTEQEVTAFLETFFSSYPTATEQELTYYVKNKALPAIEKDYTFSELINPVFQEQGNQVKVWVTVRYLDEITKAMQLSQYELTLEKDTNWIIVE
ncbi:conjugal transfer protein [Oceanobacillus sojae]|uniref:conjugal transfer protein n=1 Tax=Oceanobacillus sojae TaxID=582851 RepID=UPI0021A730B9|nr:conjugal transfer protein [Oceanobacillus sojae]MCT1905126.1 conjugal transfer protein [Oceanobacillus sojae]